MFLELDSHRNTLFSLNPECVFEKNVFRLFQAKIAYLRRPFAPRSAPRRAKWLKQKSLRIGFSSKAHLPLCSGVILSEKRTFGATCRQFRAAFPSIFWSQNTFMFEPRPDSLHQIEAGNRAQLNVKFSALAKLS